MDTKNAMMTDTTPKPRELVTLLKLTELMDSPYQSRFEGLTAVRGRTETSSDIQSLAKSIEQSGLMQPIIVRKVDKGYEIIDGHRRVQAMRRLGRGQITAIVKECSEREARIMHVVGNLQRKNLRPIELAITYQKLLDSRVFKDKRELSRAIAKDETYVGDLLATLQLDSRIIEDLAQKNLIKDLRMLRLIRNYAPVSDDGQSDRQWELYRKVIYEKMSRSELAVYVKKAAANQPQVTSWSARYSPQKVTISLRTGKLTASQKEKLQQQIARMMKEIAAGA